MSASVPKNAEGHAETSGWVEVAVHPSIHDMETIFRAAHRFTGGHHVDVVRSGPDLVLVKFKGKAGQAGTDVADEFRNELLDEGLRAIVARESRHERDLILAHALSRHPVLHAEYETAEPFSDPLSLLKPDER